MFILLHYRDPGTSSAELVVNMDRVVTMQPDAVGGTYINFEEGFSFPVAESISDIFARMRKE